MSFSNIKEKNIIKKSIEDYYKSWFKKIFERGVRDAKIYLELDCIVIIGFDVLSIMELSTIDDAYSKQVVAYSRRKVIDKNFEVLKTNIELISNRKIKNYFVDLDVESNIICMTIILEKES